MKPMSNKALEQLLDSDDELPTFYVETPEIPAYQNDHRFAFIDSELSTVNEKPAKSPTTATSHSSLNIETFHAKTQTLKKGEKVLIKTGILKKRDLYCLNCIEKVCSDETILWFVNYLLYKDSQGPNTFLTGCLVGDVFTDYSYNSQVSLYNKELRKYKFEIVLNTQ